MRFSDTVFIHDREQHKATRDIHQRLSINSRKRPTPHPMLAAQSEKSQGESGDSVPRITAGEAVHEFPGWTPMFFLRRGGTLLLTLRREATFHPSRDARPTTNRLPRVCLAQSRLGIPRLLRAFRHR